MILQSYAFADDIKIGEGSKLIISGKFENINTSGVPAIHKLMFIALTFEGDVDEEGDHTLEIIPYVNDKTYANSFTGNFSLPPSPQIGPGLKKDHVISTTDFPLPEIGVYTFEILVDGQLLSQIPYFTVAII